MHASVRVDGFLENFKAMLFYGSLRETIWLVKDSVWRLLAKRDKYFAIIASSKHIVLVPRKSPFLEFASFGSVFRVKRVAG